MKKYEKYLTENTEKQAMKVMDYLIKSSMEATKLSIDRKDKIKIHNIIGTAIDILHDILGDQ